MEKQTKARAARAARAAKELCIGLLDRLRQTRFDRHYLRHPHHLSASHLPRREIHGLHGLCRQPPLLPSAEDAAKMPLSNASNILFFFAPIGLRVLSIGFEFLHFPAASWEQRILSSKQTISTKSIQSTQNSKMMKQFFVGLAIHICLMSIWNFAYNV